MGGVDFGVTSGGAIRAICQYRTGLLTNDNFRTLFRSVVYLGILFWEASEVFLALARKARITS
jgi:hypothetical protein